MHRSPWYLFALSRWASHPAVSAFVLSWKQQCDRSWVGVRDELWGNGQVFTAEGERRGGGKKGRGETSKARQRWLMESSLRGLWHGGGGGAGVFTLSLLQGMLLLCCLADLKSANPFICVESRSCLVNNSLYKFFFLCYPESTVLVVKELKIQRADRYKLNYSFSRNQQEKDITCFQRILNPALEPVSTLG